MIPGELITADGEHELNPGRRTLTLKVSNTGERPIQVGSHYHFSETNAALGFDPADPPKLPALRILTDHVEADIGPYVRAAKQKFRRLRPYKIEPRLKPCIGDVQGDLSYPSGHATYGYVMEGVLAQLVPERRLSLEKRADQYARQRMVCGVHFRSDLEAGRTGAHYLVEHLNESAEFRRQADAASAELRAALEVPGDPPAPSVAR
jgi:hypothetical protein